MSNVTNRQANFRSASTDCWHSSDLYENSEILINDLNTMIDSHKKYMRFQNNESKQHETNASTLDSIGTNKSRLLQQQKSASLVKSQMNFIENLENPANTDQKPKDKFKSKSYLLSMGRTGNQSNVFNQSLDKNSSRSFLKKSNNSIVNCTPSSYHATISGSITSKASKCKSSQNAHIMNIPGSATTSYVNTQKKKRSSLFNLFSFNKNAPQLANSHDVSGGSHSESIRDQTGNFLESNETFSVSDLTKFNELSEVFNQPLPEFVSQWSSSNSSTTGSETLENSRSSRPHSVALYTENKNNLKPETRPAHSTNNRYTISKLNLDMDNKLNQNSHRNNNKIKSKGFSVPLNASFCLNPVPINCIHSFTKNPNNLKLIGDYDSSANNRMYKTASSIRSTANPSLISFDNNQSHKQPDLMNNLSNNFYDDDDTILFKPGDSFNIDSEGSCLKELNQRLKFADENSQTVVNPTYSDYTSFSAEKKGNIKNKLVKQNNINIDEAHTKESQITNSNENIFEGSNSNTKAASESSSNINFNSSNSNSDSKSASPFSNQSAASNIENIDNDLTRNSPKDSIMFNAFTSNRTTKYDVETKAKILNESNQINKCPVEADLMYQTKKIPFKYSITTPTELENSNENEKSMQEKNPQVLERQNSFQGYDRTENNDIASEDGSKNLNNQEKACLPIYLVIHKFDTAQSSTEIIDIMVQPKKGTKLRDLLRPIFSNQSIDVEKYSLHDQSLTATTSLVDLNSLCDAYSGVKLALKYNDRGKESVNKFIDTESTEHSKLRKKSFQGLKSDSYQNSMSENLASDSFQQSTNNWQNYFNHKMSMSKDKANNKQKRNSCIAVMNDLNSQNHISISGQANANNSSLAPSPASTLNAIASSSVTSIPNNQPSMRDSVNSIQSIIPSQGSTSPADRSHRTSVKNFRKMSQLTNIFNNYGNANKNKDQLKATMDKLLESFLIELPKLPSELCANHYNPSMFEIEPDWNKFVGDSFAQSLQKNQAKQQMAIWELLSTEASHIKTTKIIIDVFLSCLVKMKCHEQTAELFKDIEINKLFSNIIEVFNCNLNFWQTYFYPIVENLQQNNSKIIDPSMLVDGFSNFKSLFAPYEEFILEKSNSLENFKKYTEENEFFSKFIMWAENNPLVGRLKIADFMMIPVQRLTKYELLLKKIHQFTEDESKREQIAYAIDCVYALPNSINTQLKYLAQFNNISESIEKYEGIVGPTDEINDILSSYKNLDIKSPLPGCLSTSNRELIHQGPLKLKDTPKSFDVHCFLFTDILLITQLKKTKKYKIIRPPVLTNRIIVRELSQTDKAFVVISLNDYKVPESVCMFISNQSKKWIEFLEIAQLKYLDEIQKAKNFNNDTSLTMFGHKNPVRRDTSLKTPSLEITSDNVESSTDENNNSSIDSSGKPLDTNNSNERRDSSATITLSENDNKDVNVYVNYNEGQTNISENGNKETSIDERKIEANNLKTNSENSINSSNSFKSLKSGQCRQYQQQHNVRFNSRILDRRIQRRNMTDPLSTASQINSIIDEKHSVIMNSIIKRNSLNEKPKISPNKSHHLTTNLCGDSTSTILSTDSGVSSTSCENNHISYSDESISKSPSNAITFEANRENNAQQDKSIEEQNEESLKRSSLKPTNSVLSTTSSTFSSSSSSHEPNMSYSSSFNSTLSSSRFASKTNSLSKKNANKNALNEMENENRVSVEDYVNSNDTNILSGDEDYNGYYDIDETNLSNILNDPDSNVMKDLDDQNSCFTAAYNEVYPSRRLFSTVKIKNKSLSDMSNRQNQRQNRTNTIGEYINHNSNNQKYLNSPSANYDLNNNDTINNNNIKNEPIMGELGNQYFELINKSLSNQQDNQTRFNNSQLKFQQPNFSLNSNFGQNVKKKPLVKINSTTMTNDLIRVNPNDILLKNPQSNEHYHDPMSAQHCLDSNQRMTLVKLLHTTMDATEV